MGKNNKNKNKKTIKSEKPKERVTMEALAAMSDSDEEDVPKSQWNTKAKNLAQAIEDGKFDSLLEKMKGGDDDDAEIEEASLNSTSDVEEEDGDDDNGKEAQAAEEEEAESGSEEEEEEVADDQEQEQEEPEIEQDDGSENTDDEEEEEEEERPTVEDAKLKTLKANNTFNQKALAVVTAEQVAAHSKLPWAERFDIMPETPLPFGENGDPESNPLDVHDDLKREVAFYNTALEAVNLARKECQQAKVQFSRPEDFFAEMVKTDDHMAKVKDKLIFEGKKMDAVQQRKSVREQKLRAKETHTNKLAEKSKRKRDHFQQVEEWANSAAKSRGGALQDDADEVFLKGKGANNKKRQIADKKYGHGGKTGRFKQNGRESQNDISGYNPRGNFAGGMKSTGGKEKGGSGANRQGKRARDSSRSRK